LRRPLQFAKQDLESLVVSGDSFGTARRCCLESQRLRALSMNELQAFRAGSGARKSCGITLARVRRRPTDEAGQTAGTLRARARVTMDLCGRRAAPLRIAGASEIAIDLNTFNLPEHAVSRA
jgi:hypothetical protein